MYLSDETLGIILVRTELADSALVPWEMFESLCIQAATHGNADARRALLPEQKIVELLMDPHNCHSAALSADTLRRLCLQAMEQPDAAAGRM
jgi:hypothetical protein